MSQGKKENKPETPRRKSPEGDAKSGGADPDPAQKPGGGGGDGDAAVDTLDIILDGATPPDIWSDEYLETLNPPERNQDCGVTLSLPAVTFVQPDLGDVTGIRDAERIIAGLDNLVGDLVNIIREPLPDVVNRQLDPIFGPYTPPPPPPPSPIPGLPLPVPGIPNPFDPFSGLQMRIALKLGEVAGRLGGFPPRFGTTPASPPRVPFSPSQPRISVRVSRDMEVGIKIYSRMLSTYTFGRGKGTSWGVNSPTITPAARLGIDRPWFGKAAIIKSAMPQSFGIPYPMPVSSTPQGDYWIAQLGVAGEVTSLHGGGLELTVMSHGVDIRTGLNGNYGQLRVILTPPAPCRQVVGTLEVKGPYEEEIAAKAHARFAAVEAKRDAMLASLTKLQGILSLLGNVAGAVPVFGAIGAVGAQALVVQIEDKKTAFVTAINGANTRQRTINLRVAEHYPEMGPIGGAEDDPLP